MEHNSIEEVTFDLHPDISTVSLEEPISYEKMVGLMKNLKLYNEIKENGLDTPIIYYYKNRRGYLRGQVFMSYCVPQEMSLIKVGDKKSYIVHYDQASMAVHIENRILEEKGDFETQVTGELVHVSQLQIELNIEENFIW